MDTHRHCINVGQLLKNVDKHTHTRIENLGKLLTTTRNELYKSLPATGKTMSTDWNDILSLSLFTSFSPSLSFSLPLYV